MAVVTSAVVVRRGTQQFQGAFKEMWVVEATVNPASIAAGAEDSGTITATGLALGDAVVAWSAGVNLTVDIQPVVCVSAADTISIFLTNVHASSAVDLASSTWKFLVGRFA